MNSINKILLQSFCLLTILLTLSGCSLLKASAAPDAGFAPEPKLLTENRDRAPFNGYWSKDPEKLELLIDTYQAIYVAPVDTAHAEKVYNAASGSEKTKRHRIEESQELAQYFRERIKIALNNQERKELTILEEEAPNALQLKVALVGVVPTNPGVNAVGTIAGFFVPGGGLISFLVEGSVAMEGFVTDGPNQYTLHQQFKDREGKKKSPFSLKDYQKYAHIRVAIDDWSEQIAELLTTSEDHTVKDSLPVTLQAF